MSLFGQAKPAGTSLFGQSQPAQNQQQPQQTGGLFGQSTANQAQQQPQQQSTFGNSMMAQSQQAQQMPTLSQSQAQLSSSLWSPGQETPRKFLLCAHAIAVANMVQQTKNLSSSR